MSRGKVTATRGTLRYGACMRLFNPLALAATLFAAFVLAEPAAAQSYALREGDAPLGPAALETRLRGDNLTFFDDGQSRYFEDGRYTYTYGNGGGTAYGYWRFEPEGTVCIEFVHGFSRCDRYVRAGERLVLLTEGGERFPVRPGG